MTLLIYLIKLVSISALFSGYYFLFLRNTHMHQFNRFFILVSLALSIFLPLFLPLLKIPFFAAGTNTHALSSTLSGITFGNWEKTIILRAGNHFFHTIVTFQNLFLSIYLAGLLLTLYPIIKSLLYIRALAKKHQAIKFENVLLYETSEPGTPFSFINTVFWNRNISLGSEEGRQILKHELLHVNQKHSYDILFIQFLTTILWFNPFCYLMNKEMKVIHEFLADDYAAGPNKLQYAETMVMQAGSQRHIFLLNQFFYNQIKRRISMILQHTNTRYSRVRKAMVMPVMFFIFCACSVKSKDDVALQPDETYTKVQEESSFPGGSDSWMRYLNKNFRYPQQAQEQEIQGPTVVQFIVEKDGSLTDIHPISGADILSKESVRIITGSGKWIPAKQDGKVVRSYKRQPITYKLEAE
jgi:hypothetical protein